MQPLFSEFCGPHLSAAREEAHKMGQPSESCSDVTGLEMRSCGLQPLNWDTTTTNMKWSCQVLVSNLDMQGGRDNATFVGLCFFCLRKTRSNPSLVWTYKSTTHKLLDWVEKDDITTLNLPFVQENASWIHAFQFFFNSLKACAVVLLCYQTVQCSRD